MDNSSLPGIISDMAFSILPVTEPENMTMAMTNDHNITSSMPFDDNVTQGAVYNVNMTGPVTEPLLTSTFITIHFGFRYLWSFFTLFGNLLTLIAVARYETLHNNTSYLICSLAMADLLGGSLTPMVIAHQMLINDPIFIPLCLIEKYLSLLHTATNIFSIMWIAVDRYIFIAHALNYPMLVTSTRTFLVIGLTWLIISTELAVAVILGQELEIGMTCKFAVFLTKITYNYILLPQLLVVFLITVGFYIAIARIAYKQGKAIAALNQPYDTYEASANRQQKRIAKMMITVLSTFFICYIPQSIASILLKIYETPTFIILEKITVIIYWMNTWANPIIYAWKSKDFRVAFRKLLGLKPTNTVGSFVVPDAAYSH